MTETNHQSCSICFSFEESQYSNLFHSGSLKLFALRKVSLCQGNVHEHEKIQAIKLKACNEVANSDKSNLGMVTTLAMSTISSST